MILVNFIELTVKPPRKSNSLEALVLGIFNKMDDIYKMFLLYQLPTKRFLTYVYYYFLIFRSLIIQIFRLFCWYKKYSRRFCH